MEAFGISFSKLTMKGVCSLQSERWIVCSLTVSSFACRHALYLLGSSRSQPCRTKCLRDNSLPVGTTSKKDAGACNTDHRRPLCNFCAAASPPPANEKALQQRATT